MKLSRKPCRILGVRVGEVAANLLAPSAVSVSAKFFLIGPEGEGLGSYTIDRGWGPKTVEAFQNLVEAMELDALVRLFDDEAEVATAQPTSLSFPQVPTVPTLGGSKKNNPP